MADHRAMEEQEERENPINPKGLLSNRRENAQRLSGQGATPSMGLSKYRGGAVRKKPSEAYEMGKHLGVHLHQLHGGAFHRDFCEGMSGGGFFDSIKNAFDPSKNGVGNAFNTVKNEFVNPNSVLRHDVAPKVANEFTDPNSVLRGQVIPIGAQVAQYSQPFVDMAVPGLGTAINTGFKAANYANKGAKMLGYGGERIVGGKPPTAGTLKKEAEALAYMEGLMKTGITANGAIEQHYRVFRTIAKGRLAQLLANKGHAVDYADGRFNWRQKKDRDDEDDEPDDDAHLLLNFSKKARVSDKEGSGRGESQRAQTMLGQMKKGRARNNGVPLLSGGMFGLPKYSAKEQAIMNKTRNRVRGSGVKPNKSLLSKMFGRGIGAGMLEEPMPITGTNLSLSGSGQTGAYEGQGRSKRAEIVKRVMAEKGLKMIEASKYVKEHGLY